MTELAAIVRQLDWVLDQVAICLREVPGSDATWRPSTGGSNDALTIASHVVGATRAYALGLGVGHAVGRDRLAEFEASSRSAADVLRELADLRDALRATAEEVVDLDEPVVVPEAWVGPAAEGTRRDALLEALRHASIHLGELRLVRDLALGR